MQNDQFTLRQPSYRAHHLHSPLVSYAFFAIVFSVFLGTSVPVSAAPAAAAPAAAAPAAPKQGSPAQGSSDTEPNADGASASQAKQGRVEANPRSLEANDQGIAALKTGNIRTAEERFRRALEVEPGNLTAAFNLSGTLIVNGKKLEAISLLSEYGKKYPLDAGFAVRLGDVLFSSEKVKEATLHYERALKIQSSYPQLYEKLALAYALTQRVGESEKMYTLAAAQNPKDGELLTNLASIQLANNNIDAAIVTAKRAAQISPSARLYLTLGSALESQAQENEALLQEALSALKRSQELDKDNADVGERIAALKKRIEDSGQSE